MLLPCDHQAGEIEGVLMWWRIGTVVETELTIIALIDDPMVVGLCELGDVAIIPIDPVEQRVERRTKIEAAPTAIADFIDALRVFLELRGIDGIDQTQAVHVAPIKKHSAVSYQRQEESDPHPASLKTDR
jgi:hypothetical protein